jgi:hypothetical protein
LTNPRWDDHLHNTAYGQNGYNRWFDKTISMSVESNTRLGMMGEHSPCDALIPSILGDYCVEAPMNLEDFDQTLTENDLLANREGGWRRIAWATDNYLQSECQRVAEQAQTLVEDSDDSQLWFENYGVDWIRGTGRSVISYKRQLLLSGILFLQLSYPPMLISKWPSSWLGIKTKASLRQCMKRLRLVYSCMVAPKLSDHSAEKVFYSFRQ